MKSTNKTIKLIVEKTDTGYSAYSADYPIFTTGQTISDLQNNAFEATNLYFEKEPVPISRQDMKFEIDFQQFFKYYNVLNAKFWPTKLG